MLEQDRFFSSVSARPNLISLSESDWDRVLLALSPPQRGFTCPTTLLYVRTSLLLLACDSAISPDRTPSNRIIVASMRSVKRPCRPPQEVTVEVTVPQYFWHAVVPRSST